MDVHAKPAALIGLERDLLSGDDQEDVLRHLKTCPLCATRRQEIQAELLAMDSTEPAAGPVGRHVPPGILAGFVAAPAAIGPDLAARVAEHTARCSRCREAATRAARPRPEPAAATKRPIPLAPFLRFRRGVALRDPDSGRRRRPFWSLGRGSWPAISGLVLAAIILGILLPRWLSEREAEQRLTVATPLRLLGNTGAVTPPATVSLEPGTSLALFLKLPVPPPSHGRYELSLKRPGGLELKRQIPGSAIDPSGTVAILIDPQILRAGERIEVRVSAFGDAAGVVVFSDAFTVESAVPTRAR